MCTDDHDAGSGGSHGDKPSPSAYMANLRKPMPVDRRIGLVLKNTGRKVIHLKSCCGHPGEPGC